MSVTEAIRPLFAKPSAALWTDKFLIFRSVLRFFTVGFEIFEKIGHPPG
jgi:hypothetical protein